jgi:Protein of unknown function (DUF4242)
MPRYLFERTFPQRHSHPARAEVEGVTWVHSYVNEERTKIVCVYDAPSPAAVRKAAAADLPVDAITEIRVV